MVSLGTVNLSDELPPSVMASVRVERLLTHFRRFLAPDDDRILSLEERLAALQSLAEPSRQQQSA